MGNGRSWAEVDLQVIVNNYKSYYQYSNCDVMAVVKANAYGHGAVAVSKKLQENGVHLFAVATIEEAIELRESGIEGVILILGYTPLEQLDQLIRYDISQSVISEEYAQMLINTGKPYKVHIALDTGMNRIGIKTYDLDYCEKIIRKCFESLILEGVFTHLCVADSTTKDNENFTNKQIHKFDSVIDRVQDMKIPYKHCMNSASGLFYKSRHSNMNRLGILMYGLLPDIDLHLPIDIKPALKWKSIITMTKDVLPGETIGYGRSYKASGNMRIGIVAAGYADGYNRLLSNKGYVLIHGRKASIVGRVCMDQFMVDITGIEVNPGDEVELINDTNFTADNMAKLIGTIGYEVVCNISQRVPKYYL